MKMALKMGAGALVVGLSFLPGAARAAEEAIKDLPGPIDSLQDLEDTGKMLFKMADENNDGQISQKEANDALDGIVGGFFFRADTNGDGVVSREELQASRQDFLNQKPLVRMLIQQMRAEKNAPGIQPVAAGNTAQNAARGALSLVDSNNDGNIQATEVRQMVQTSVQSLFAAADTNRDGQLSPAEINSAIVGAAKAAAQAAFQKADTDGNGQLNQAEFDKALTEPAHAVFRVLDANNDGQLSVDELRRAQQSIANQILRLQVPDAPNSPLRQLQGGAATGGIGQPGAVPAGTTTTTVRP